jgi:phenylacetate-CoA ligase
MKMDRFRRHFFEPLLVKKPGARRLAYWRKLERTQYLPRQELEEIQWRRLLELWEYLWNHNQFYRQRFLSANLEMNSMQSPQDIKWIPVLTKKEIRKNTDSLISAGYSKNQLQHFQTGGSTGKALDIFMTEECSELRNACARRHDRWTGWEPGEPVGAAWGNPKLPRSFKERIKHGLVQPYIYLDTMNVSEESVKRFARAWNKTRPTLLYGHAHSLFILAQEVQRIGITEIRPKGILSTSMTLLPHERSLIERTFNCTVTNRYGCEEVSLIGSECERHEGMHLNIEHLFIEFLREDGSDAQPGEQGNIVVTDLMNRAMPFVRYKVEDVGTPTDRMCSCGRGLPLMERVTGRIADFLIRKDGSKVAGISLIENTLTKIDGIDQMQIIQEDLNHIRLRVVPNENFSHERRKQLESCFQALFAGDIRTQIEIINSIEPESSGKYRFSICKVASHS